MCVLFLDGAVGIVAAEREGRAILFLLGGLVDPVLQRESSGRICELPNQLHRQTNALLTCSPPLPSFHSWYRRPETEPLSLSTLARTSSLRAVRVALAPMLKYLHCVSAGCVTSRPSRGRSKGIPNELDDSEEHNSVSVWPLALILQQARTRGFRARIWQEWATCLKLARRSSEESLFGNSRPHPWRPVPCCSSRAVLLLCFFCLDHTRLSVHTALTP